MGYPYAELIGPAILLDNPGVTKEEFSKLVDATHTSDYKEFSFKDKWSAHEKRSIHKEMGLGRLAQMLKLGDSPVFEKFKETTYDENGFPLYAPICVPVIPLYWGKTDPGYDVHIHEGNIKTEGGYQPASRVENYADLTSLYKVWPQYIPENMYDFDQQSGNFSIVYNGRDFRWFNKDGRYYLDPATFDLIPISFRSSAWKGFGYTDLILTAEAIRLKAWKLLSRRGLSHKMAFLRDFPAANERYTKAVIDAESSINAKQRGLTNAAFLRMRLGILS